MLLDGASRPDLIEAIRTLFPNREPLELLGSALEGFKVAASERQEIVLGWCIEASRDLYRRLVEVGDFDGALRAVKQIAALSLPKERPPAAPDMPLELPAITL